MRDFHQTHRQPHVLSAIRSDLANSREWFVRAVVLVYAALAGLSVVAFIWLSERALQGFEAIRAANPLLPFAWTPLACAALAWVTVRFFPGASGSGIPQVMAALQPSVIPRDRPQLVSLRLALAKIWLTAGGLLGGWRSAAKDRRCRSRPASCCTPGAGCPMARRSGRTRCWWPAAPPASRRRSMPRWRA